MTDKTIEWELAATRDALHRACYALITLQWEEDSSSQPPTHLWALRVAANFLREAKGEEEE